MLGRDIFVFHVGGASLSVLEHVRELPRKARLPGTTIHLRPGCDLLLEIGAQHRRAAGDAADDRRDDPVLLPDERKHKVQGFDRGVLVTLRQRLCIQQRFLRLLGIPFQIHLYLLLFRVFSGAR